MSDIEFLLLAFDHIGLLALLMFCGCFILYFSTPKAGFGLADPLHFFYAFTFGTSYGVVALLAITNKLSMGAITLVFGFGGLWLMGLWIGQSAILKPLFKLTPINVASDTTRTLSALRRALFLSSILVCVYFAIVGSPFAVDSRFEANRGIGFIARLLDPLRIVIAGLLYATTRNKSILLRGLALSYVVILSLASGAKFALLECGYAAWITSQLIAPRFANKVRAGRLRRIFLYLSVILIATSFALVFLNFGFQAREAEDVGRTTYAEGVSLPVELLVLRIIGNGDMYYLGLPNDTYFQVVSVHNPLAQLFGPLVGDGVMKNFFDYNLADSEIGRQIWLYWYPGDTVIRGPTSHFELVAYSYFGPLLGGVFCIVLGVSVGWLRRTMFRSHSLAGWKAALLSALYIRILISLLSPGLSMTYLIDLAFVFFILTCQFTPRRAKKFNLAE